MGYVKVTKSSPYFSRYQVKYRRRRQGKTDYRARLRLTTQDKNKYNTPKYRFVVRFTNRDIICQVAYATLSGDIIVAAAYSHELPNFGLKVGLSNYAAAYATGLLCARRVLKKFNLDEIYPGVEKANGEPYNVEEVDGESRPFTALLDTGLKRTSTGSKVFAAMKGAVDGGLDIPHSEKRFVGYSREDKRLDPETLRKYIYGGHVAEFMETLEEEEPEKYETQFSKFIEEEVTAEDLEDLYAKVHEAIRADPTPKKKERPAFEGEKQRWKTPKLTYDERKEKLKERLAELAEDAE